LRQFTVPAAKRFAHGCNQQSDLSTHGVRRPKLIKAQEAINMDSANINQHVKEDIEQEVIRRYAEGAKAVEPSLCCPVSYDGEFLKILPQEIIEKDYGCGDPSKYTQTGDTVLDLGSGAGKICYILAQKVGKDGAVIGVDFNDTMLNLARKYQDEMAEKIGHANTEFRKGRIQDLGLSMDKAQAWLEANPIKSVDDLQRFEAESERLRREDPLIETNSIDLIVSNCVLNLVKPEDKQKLFKDMFRVIRPGGRAVISDIVCDVDPTRAILSDPELWSGCISGAFREDLFPRMFADAGFVGMEILERQEEPWQVIDGVEFRSMTIRAWKPTVNVSLDGTKRDVVYRGPWARVTDDKGRMIERGQRTQVSTHEFEEIANGTSPYAASLIPIDAAPQAAAAKSDDCCSGSSCC
jgi:ubiquinone/menaquinone biosynthesis C-methylase UbiE